MKALSPSVHQHLLSACCVWCLALLAHASTASAAILFEENFDTLAPGLQSAVIEPVDAAVKGWTHNAPLGWAIDNSRMDTSVGVPEWSGWSFTTLPFWVACATQGREQFTRAENVFAVGDSDEYDDLDAPPPFDSTLASPVIPIPAGKPVYLSFDTICPQLSDHTVHLLASIDGGPDQLIKDYRFLNLGNVEETVRVPAPNTLQPWTLVLKWRYAGKNAWFWGIDNIRVSDSPPPPSPPPFQLGGAGDWCTYRRDCRRSGITSAGVNLPLNPAWVHTPAHKPVPAWPEPAREDIAHRIAALSATTVYDRVFHVAASGESIFYGSSADDSVYCLDAATGRVLWAFTTEGPIRLAPTVTQGRVYAGSDDGCVYCLDAASGTLLWKYRAVPEDRRMPGNGRMISRWPVRSGVAVDRGPLRTNGEPEEAPPLIAFFSAGLFPEEGVYLCAVDAESGAEVWKEKISAASQGYMLASSSQLYLPTGRTAPAVFDRNRGKALGSFEGLGGNFAVVLDDMVVAGPSESGELHINTPVLRERVISAPGVALVATRDVTYFLKQDGLVALDRTRFLELSKHIATIEQIKERTPQQEQRLGQLRVERASCELWSVPLQTAYTMILADDVLLVGHENQVAAHSTVDGAQLWAGEVEGKAYGLAVAHGRLIVSTDKGQIWSFENGQSELRRESASVVLHPTDGKSSQLADCIIAHGGFDRGYCLVLGGDGPLLCELAQRSGLRIIGVEPVPERAETARAELRKAGLNGARVAVHKASQASLPYQDQTINVIALVCSEEAGPVPATPAAEVLRLLRPCGGTALVWGSDAAALEEWGRDLPDWRVTVDANGTWGMARRGPLEGAGEWTHTYAEPGNSASSGDILVGAPLELQWFGAPGPRRMIDRHFRNVPPLYKDGRLFVPGDEIVYVVDAYNGAHFWHVEVPGSRRAGVFLDSSNIMVDETCLYLVADEVCHRFDVVTGRGMAAFTMPGRQSVVPQEWGYLSRSGNTLIGSGRPKGTGISEITNEMQMDTRPLWYPNMLVALSECVFALDRTDGSILWTYASGRILDTTLTVGDGRVYFVETQNEKPLADTTGRLSMLDVTEGGHQFLVALDIATGEPVYREPVDMTNIQQPCYLNLAKGVLLLSGSKIDGGEHIRASGTAAKSAITGKEIVHYYYYAFDAGTGALRWRTDNPTDLAPDGGHGEYNRHPTLIGDIAYLWPFAHNIITGELVEGWVFDRHGHGCGGISGSVNALFWRGNNPWMRDLRPNGGSSPINVVTRPGCWINIIPAGGLVLIPEASSGCTCAYPLQTSLAYRPM